MSHDEARSADRAGISATGVIKSEIGPTASELTTLLMFAIQCFKNHPCLLASVLGRKEPDHDNERLAYSGR